MAKTEESILEEKVEKFMKDRHVWQLARFQAASNQNGIPDRLYLYKGFLLGLELKTHTGSPNDLQKKKIAAINENGGIGVIITKVEQIDRLLNNIDNYTKRRKEEECYSLMYLTAIENLIYEYNKKYY